MRWEVEVERKTWCQLIVDIVARARGKVVVVEKRWSRPEVFEALGCMEPEMEGMPVEGISQDLWNSISVRSKPARRSGSTISTERNAARWSTISERACLSLIVRPFVRVRRRRSRPDQLSVSSQLAEFAAEAGEGRCEQGSDFRHRFAEDEAGRGNDSNNPSCLSEAGEADPKPASMQFADLFKRGVVGREFFGSDDDRSVPCNWLFVAFGVAFHGFAGRVEAFPENGFAGVRDC